MSFTLQNALDSAKSNARYFGVPYAVAYCSDGKWRSNSVRSFEQQAFVVAFPDGSVERTSVETTVGALIARHRAPEVRG
jgi:hypothetical protein